MSQFKTTLIILCFLVFSSMNASGQKQKQTINVWYFSSFEDKETQVISNLKAKLGKNANKKYIISLNNIYVSEQVIYNNDNDFASLPINIVNNLELNEDQILSNIIQSTTNKIITIDKDPRKNELNITDLIQTRANKKLRICDNLHSSDLNYIKKSIKRTKKGNIDI